MERADIENGTTHLYFMLMLHYFPKKARLQYIEVGFLNRMPSRNWPTFILTSSCWCTTKPIKPAYISQFENTTNTSEYLEIPVHFLGTLMAYFKTFPYFSTRSVWSDNHHSLQFSFC